MGDQPIGSMLRAKREKLGLSLDQMSTITNIRPGLLEAFEESDYKHHPAKGFASGMLSSYARALNIDPRTILSGYELELKDYEQSKTIESGAKNARRGRDVNGFRRPSSPASRRRAAKNPDAQDSKIDEVDRQDGPIGSHDTAGNIARATSSVKVLGSRSARNSRSTHRGSRSSYSSSGGTGHFETVGSEERGSSFEAYKRSMKERYSSASEPGSRAVDSARNLSTTGRLTKLAESTGAFAALESPRDSKPEELGSSHERRRKTTRRRSSSSGSGSQASSRARKHHEPAENDGLVQRVFGAVREAFADKRTRLIVVAVACVAVALVLVASILLSTAGRDDAGIIDVSGGAGEQTLTEGGTDKDTGAAVATVTTANGNPVTVTVDVAQGKTSLINIVYDDDKAYDGTAVGPWHREFQVTKSFSGTFGTVSSVSVLVNGSAPEIAPRDDGSGSLEINVQADSLAGSK